MEALLAWLAKEVPLNHLWLYAAGGIVIDLLLILAAIVLIRLLYPEYFDFLEYLAKQDKNNRKKNPQSITAFDMLFAVAKEGRQLLILATTEELVFRFIPLFIAVKIAGVSWWVLLVAVVSSIVFGQLHGTVKNIFTQGPGGLLYCLLFLKCGGFQGGEHLLLALATVIIVHAVTNLILWVTTRLRKQTRF